MNTFNSHFVYFPPTTQYSQSVFHVETLHCANALFHFETDGFFGVHKKKKEREKKMNESECVTLALLFSIIRFLDSNEQRERGDSNYHRAREKVNLHEFQDHLSCC